MSHISFPSREDGLDQRHWQKVIKTRHGSCLETAPRLTGCHPEERKGCLLLSDHTQPIWVDGGFSQVCGGYSQGSHPGRSNLSTQGNIGDLLVSHSYDQVTKGMREGNVLIKGYKIANTFNYVRVTQHCGWTGWTLLKPVSAVIQLLSQPGELPGTFALSFIQGVCLSVWL